MPTNWRLNDFVAAMLLALMIWAPLPLGSNRPVFWMMSATIIFLTMAVFLIGSGLRGKKLSTPFNKTVVIFILATIYAIFIGMQIVENGFIPASVTPRASLLALIRTVSYICFFFLMLQVSANTQRAVWMSKVMFYAVAVYAAVGFLMVFGVFELPEIFDKNDYFGHATATFVNRNSYATYLGFGILLGVALLVRRIRELSGITQSKVAQIIDVKVSTYLGLISLMLVTLISTNSRMGNAAFMLAAATFLAVVLGKRARISGIRAVLVAAAILATTVAALFMYGETLLVRLGSTENDFDVRFQLYVQVWDMIMARPLSGFGADSFPLAFQGFHQWPVSPDLVWDKAHNTYLTNWAETGLIFGSLPLAITLILVLKMLKFVTAHRRNFIPPLLALCVILQAAIHSLVDFSLEIQANMFLFLAILALGYAHTLTSKGTISKK